MSRISPPAWRLLLATLASVAIIAFMYFNWARLAVWYMAEHWHQASKSTPALGLSDYMVSIEARPIRGLTKNTSGLTYNPHSNTLFTAINNPPAVAELSREGELLRYIDLPGAGDPEGISHIHDDLFVVADEARNQLLWVRIDEITHIAHIQETTSPALDFKHLSNRGFEGISWDASRSELLLANEKRPRRVLFMHGLLPARPGSKPHFRVWHPDNWFGVLGNDLASLAVHDETGNLLLLSEESALVTEYSRAGKILGVLPLWSGASGLRQTVPQAEGLTVGPDGSIYIVSEPNLFYRFEKRRESDTPARSP